MKTLIQKSRWVARRSLLSVALLGSTACDKIDDIITPKLPDATQEGKVTFGCLVDGKVWLPYTEHTLDRAIEAKYSANSFTLRAERETKDGGYIHLRVFNASEIKAGTYSLANGFAATYDLNTHFATTTPGQGSVTLTKVEPTTREVLGSTLHYTIVSGTFDFTGTDAAGKIVTIKDGRFDVLARP